MGHPFSLAVAAQATADAAMAAAIAAQATADAAVKAMYGQVRDNTPQAQTINAGWTPLLNYDTALPSPVGVTQNLAAGTLELLGPGVYSLNATFDITFTSSNAGRNTHMRLFNVTDGVAVIDFQVPIGRDVDGATAAVTGLFDAPTGNKVCRLEVGGGDALSNVSRRGCAFGVHRVSP